MRTAKTCALLAVLLPLALLLACPFSGRGTNALVAFGDSYTDTGNLPSSPPDYWNSRFSNGPLWIEYLSQSLGFAYNSANNYAVGGTESEDLGGQIANFPGTSDSANVFFAIWSGNNDFGNHLNLGTSDSAWNRQINDAISSLMAASDLLYQKGARNLILFNQLDLTRLPYIRNHYSATFRSYVLTKIKTFNSRLTAAVPNLLNSHPGLQVYFVDIYSDLNYLLNNYSAYGFTVATQDALEDPNVPDSNFTGPGANYVFWDSQHPTTKTHSLIGSWVLSLLPAPPSPPSIALSTPQTGSQFTASATIPLMASLDANGWAINQVAFFQNGLLLGQEGSPPYTFIWQSVPTGSYSLTAQVTYGSGQTVTSSSVEVTVAAQTSSPLPSPWNHQDVGTLGQPGSVAYATNSTFTVIGSGADIWDTADAFHYVYQPFSGDGTIIVRVTGVQKTDGFAKGGLMFRESLDPSSPNALEFITPSSGTGFQTRAGTNAATSYTQGTTVSPPYWLKLERLGNKFNGYTSPDGSIWTVSGSATIPMALTIYAGLAVTAHNNSTLNTSTFTNVQITQPTVPPVLAMRQLTDGTIQLTLTGAIGATYRCDASTDLAVWTPISTNLNSSGIIQITDSQGLNLAQRFYRAVLVR